MALVFPSLPHHHALSAGEHAELAVLRTLEQGLPDAYSLFHNVEWGNLTTSGQQHGEIDIVVVNQAADLLLIEVKAGDVQMDASGITKRYGAETKDVVYQTRRQFSAMRSRLSDEQLTVQVSQLLVLPNVVVSSHPVSWPKSSIVDSHGMPDLVGQVREILGTGVPKPVLRERMQAFLENRFQVAVDVTAMASRLTPVVSRLSSGLATWVPRISAPSGVIRVVGTAGSGKTQLALALLRQADVQGHKTAYLCFNRPLADHLARIAPVRSQVETFHEYAKNQAQRDGLDVDMSKPDAFDQLVDHCIAGAESAPSDLDLLVIDELQDFKPAWVQALSQRLAPQGRLYVLEDSDQCLYKDREPFEIADAVVVETRENYRSPRAIVDLINTLGLVKPAVEARSPYAGRFEDPLVYKDDAAMLGTTIAAVQRCLDKGYGLPDIAVISLKGRERSQFLKLDKIGAWSTRRFTGQFDEGGSAVWSDGELLVESVRRFKGQAAVAVVLTECDFEDLSELNRRLLFVGMTRAQMHLEWVVSAQAERALIGQH